MKYDQTLLMRIKCQTKNDTTTVQLFSRDSVQGRERERENDGEGERGRRPKHAYSSVSNNNNIQYKAVCEREGERSCKYTLRMEE